MCDRTLLDLPLADLIESELFKHVQQQEEQQAQQAGSSANQPATQSADASLPSSFPTRSVYECFRGLWLIDSFRDGSADTPPLLRLTAALHTPSKMALMRDIERQEKRKEKMEAAAAKKQPTQQAASSAPASSSPSPPPPVPLSSPYSLSPSTAVDVLVPRSVLALLGECSDGGRGWQISLELTRYRRDDASGEPEQFFHITNAGHVTCL